MKLSSVSFFCPALNERENLPKLISHVQSVLPRLADQFEIIIIDDGSTDGTQIIAKKLEDSYPHIRVIHHNTNLGYGVSLAEGFKTAKYDYIMYTDADFQYDIGQFLPYIDMLKDHDILSGYVKKKAASLGRSFQSFIYNQIIRLFFGTSFRDINCAMKIYSRKVIDNITIKSHGFFVDAEMLIKSSRKGFRVAQFPVAHLPRSSGVATGSHPLLILQTIAEIIKFRVGFL